MLRAAAQRLQLSARASRRAVKLARAISDLAGADTIAAPHIADLAGAEVIAALLRTYDWVWGHRGA